MLAEGDTCRVAAEVLCGEGREGAPAAADVEEPVLGLKIEFVAYEVELVVLQLFERLFPVDVHDDAGGVDHARAEEPKP